MGGYYYDHRPETESAVLVGVISRKQTEDEVKEYLEELAFLTETAGATPAGFFTQKMDIPNARTYIGSGKLMEIKHFVKENENRLIAFKKPKPIFFVGRFGSAGPE